MSAHLKQKLAYALRRSAAVKAFQKIASTALTRHFIPKIMALGRTPAARAAAIEANPMVLGANFARAQAGAAAGKITDFSRRALFNIPRAQRKSGGQSANVGGFSHPEGGLAFGKAVPGSEDVVRLGMNPRFDAQAAGTINRVTGRPEPLAPMTRNQALMREWGGSRIARNAAVKDAELNPQLGRPDFSHAYGIDSSPVSGREMYRTHSGVGSLAVGQPRRVSEKLGPKQTYMNVDLSDPKVLEKIMGTQAANKLLGRASHISRRTGRPIYRDPDQGFINRLVEGQRAQYRDVPDFTLARRGDPKTGPIAPWDETQKINPMKWTENLGGLNRGVRDIEGPTGDAVRTATDRLPMIFSKFISNQPGGMQNRPDHARMLLDYYQRLRRQQNVSALDPHMRNTRYLTQAGEQVRPTLFDFGNWYKHTPKAAEEGRGLFSGSTSRVTSGGARPIEGEAYLKEMMEGSPRSGPLWPSSLAEERFIEAVRRAGPQGGLPGGKWWPKS